MPPPPVPDRPAPAPPPFRSPAEAAGTLAGSAPAAPALSGSYAAEERVSEAVFEDIAPARADARARPAGSAWVDEGAQASDDTPGAAPGRRPLPAWEPPASPSGDGAPSEPAPGHALGLAPPAPGEGSTLPPGFPPPASEAPASPHALVPFGAPRETPPPAPEPLLPARAPGAGAGQALGTPLRPEPPARVQTRRAVRERATMARRHWPLVALSTLAGLLLFGLYGLFAPKEYAAYSVLLVSAEGPGTSDFARGLAVPGEGPSRVMNQALILQQDPAIAEDVAARLLARPDAAALPTVQAAGRAPGQAFPDVPALADHLQRHVVTVAPSGEGVDALRVEARSARADEAALIAGLYTEAYLGRSGRTTQAGVAETRAALEAQVAEREGELVAVENGLARYLTASGAAGLDEQTRAAIGQTADLQRALDAADVEARTRAARLAQLEREAAAVQPRLAARAASSADAEATAVDGRIADLERLLEQVFAQHPDLRINPSHHPDTRALVDRLEGLRADRRRLAARQARDVVASGGVDLQSTGPNGPAYIAGLQQQIGAERAALEGARAQAGALAPRLAQARAQLRAVPGQQAEVDRIERRRDGLRASLADLSARLQQARAADETQPTLARVIRPVRVPLRPTNPSLPVLLALGGLLGLLAGLAGAALRFRTDSRVYTPGDLAEQGFAVVGTVPPVAPAPRGAGGAPDAPGFGMVTLTAPHAAPAEAFRHLHAGLAAGGARAPRVVLVTSAEGGAGTSLVAANLAVAAARAGRRTLLIDADGRAPSARALLGLGQAEPLGEGGDQMRVAYWGTGVPGLFALTPRAEGGQDEPLWAPPQMARLLQSLREAFDLVILDTPPALLAADAALLAPSADAALLVARAGRTDAEALAHVAGELASVGLTQVGAVLNGFDAGRAVGYRRTLGQRQAPARPVRL